MTQVVKRVESFGIIFQNPVNFVVRQWILGDRNLKKQRKWEEKKQTGLKWNKQNKNYEHKKDNA